MKRVVVTGGSGKAGRAVLAALGAAGYEVLNVDLTIGDDHPGVAADLVDLGQASELVAGVEAVVHLAAIPAPGLRSEGDTFRVNTLSTYNVFSAAVRAGVERVVWASSETVLGLPFDARPPEFAPVDETHPPRPESSYALSKLVGEQMAAQFGRWSGIPIVGLRYSNIMEPDDYAAFPSYWEDPRLRAWNLWGYVDAADVAQATRLALEAPLEGTPVFIVAAADTVMDRPSGDLMAEVFPRVPLTRPLPGHQTLLSIERAAAALGYRPARSWRDYL